MGYEYAKRYWEQNVKEVDRKYGNNSLRRKSRSKKAEKWGNLENWETETVVTASVSARLTNIGDV